VAVPAEAAVRGPGSGGGSALGRSLSPERALLWGVGALALAALLASLWWPLSMDQGIFAWVGDTIRRGRMPYRDAWDVKGPLVYYAYAAVETLFGRNMWGVRVLDAAILAATAWTLRRVVGRLASPTAGWWTAAGFVLWYLSLSFEDTAQPDGWAGALVLFAVAPLLDPSRQRTARRLAVAGLLIGLATLLKPFYAGFLALPALCWLVRPRRRVVDLLALGAGWAVPVAVAAAWMAAHGALAATVDVYLLYTAQVYSQVSGLALGSRIGGVVAFFWELRRVALAVPAMLVGAVALWRTRRDAAVVLVGWALLATAFVALQNRFFPYHWLPVVPPLAALVGVGYHRLLGRDGRSRAGRWAEVRLFATLSSAVLVAELAVRPALLAARWGALVAGRSSPAAFYGEPTASSWVVPAQTLAAARYVAAHSAPGDPVAIWGFDAALLYLADRAGPSRFAGSSVGLTQGPGSVVRREYRREFERALTATPPALFVVNRDTVRVPPEFRIEQFPELEQFLASRYQLASRFGDLAVYRYAGQAGAPPAAATSAGP
jgi:hypothetical protein